jgi:hypothetical protein
VLWYGAVPLRDLAPMINVGQAAAETARSVLGVYRTDPAGAGWAERLELGLKTSTER